MLQRVGMTFEEAAALDPDEAGGELDEGTWVPGTRSTWRRGKIAAMSTPNHIRILGGEDVLDGGDVLPGFSCRVREIFE